MVHKNDLFLRFTQGKISIWEDWTFDLVVVKHEFRDLKIGNFEVTTVLAEAADQDGQEPHRPAIQVGFIYVYSVTIRSEPWNKVLA